MGDRPTQQRGSEGGLGRGRHPLGDRALRAAARSEATHREIALSSLKRVFGLGETLATTLIGLASRIAAKICAYTPTLFWSTGRWGVLKVTSRSCGHEPDNRHLELKTGLPGIMSISHLIKSLRE